MDSARCCKSKKAFLKYATICFKMGRFKNRDESEDLPNSVLKLSGKQKRIKKTADIYDAVFSFFSDFYNG
jgi:hypothetical protein